MQRGEVEVAGSGSRNILVTVASASFGLGALLTVVVFARGTRVEFRWLSPGAQRSGVPAWHRTGETGQPVTWLLLRPASWRPTVPLAGKRLRIIRGWPWLVIHCGALALLLCVATWVVFDRRPLALGPNARTVFTLACGAARAAVLRALLFVTLAGATIGACFAWDGADARRLALVTALLPAVIACEFVLRAVLMRFSPPGVGLASLDVLNSAVARLLMRPLASSATLGETMHHQSLFLPLVAVPLPQSFSCPQARTGFSAPESGGLDRRLCSYGKPTVGRMARWQIISGRSPESMTDLA